MECGVWSVECVRCVRCVQCVAVGCLLRDPAMTWPKSSRLTPKVSAIGREPCCIERGEDEDGTTSRAKCDCHSSGSLLPTAHPPPLEAGLCKGVLGEYTNSVKKKIASSRTQHMTERRLTR